MIEDHKNRIIDDKLSQATQENLGEEPDFLKLMQDVFQKKKRDYYIIIYRVNEVIIEKYDPNTIDSIKTNFTSKYLKEFRMFSEDLEFYVWKSKEGFSSRIREDGAGAQVEIYEEEHIMWGTDIVDEVLLVEKNRGIQIKLPIDLVDSLKIKNEDDLPLKIVVYNYFQEDKEDTSLVKFIDSRLVKFKKNKGEVING